MNIRRSNRLRDCDYRQQGVYFITICTYRQVCLYGEVTDGSMQLNQLGRIVAQEWQRTAVLRPYVDLDAFVVMPNHIHGVIVIVEENTDAGGSAKLLAAKSLGAIVGQFKGSVTKRIRLLEGLPDIIVWQRNFHDHVVRNDKSLQRIREYIAYNPENWAEDFYFDDNRPEAMGLYGLKRGRFSETPLQWPGV